jgi:hypothetical protein
LAKVRTEILPKLVFEAVSKLVFEVVCLLTNQVLSKLGIQVLTHVCLQVIDLICLIGSLIHFVNRLLVGVKHQIDLVTLERERVVHFHSK